MDFLLSQVLGPFGITGIIGVAVFLFCYKYSKGIFDWVESQTLGTQNYLSEKLEFLFIKVDPFKITYGPVALAFGLGILCLITLGLLVSWILGFIVGVVAIFVGFKIPRLVVDFLIKKRINDYVGQMVDGLTLLSNGLRAGLSVPQALAMVVDEMPAPISQEFNVILQQNRIGMPLEECFENLAKRMPTEDNDMFVTSVNILRETGGNLSEVFETIIEVIRERVRLKQKIDTVTAQGRFQAYTISALPFAMLFFLTASDPETMGKVFQSIIGIVLIFIAICLVGVGLLVILKIVNIKL